MSKYESQFDGRCGSCVYMNTNDWVGGRNTKCKCTKRNWYYELTEKECDYHKTDHGKNYEELARRCRYCRWYVVSAIFDKLGLSDDYESIALLHSFREEYLEKNEKYKKFLGMYDLEGPKMAQFIMEDEESEELCRNIVQNVLVHVLDCIKNGDNEKAMDYYIQMLSILKLRYEEKFNDEVIKIK